MCIPKHDMTKAGQEQNPPSVKNILTAQQQAVWTQGKMGKYFSDNLVKFFGIEAYSLTVIWFFTQHLKPNHSGMTGLITKD